MTDFFLLSSNMLVGLLLFGLWWSDRTRPQFAYWGCGQALMAAGAALVLALQLTGWDSLSPHLKLQVLWVITAGMCFMVGGSIAYLDRPVSLGRVLVPSFGVTAVLGLVQWQLPEASSWFISAGLLVAYGSISVVVWKDGILERVAGLLFLLCGLNTISLTLSGGYGNNPIQAHIGHLLSLAGAICLLLSTFERRTQELQRRNELLTFSNELITTLQEQGDEQSLAREALRLLSGKENERYGLIHMLNQDGTAFELLASVRHPESVLQIVRNMPVEDTLSGVAIRSGKAIVTHEYVKEPGAWSELAKAYARTGVQANASVPLMIGTRALGVMNISYPDRHEFSKRELDTLKAAGQVIAICLERIRHIHDLAYRVSHDTLTGLGNRETLHACFALETQRAEPGTTALLLLDINRFKEVNDTLGHQVGDRLLLAVAKVLSNAHEHVFRLGGDEFAILLPRQANEAAARSMAQALVETVNQPLMVDGMSLHVDVAIGIAFYPRHGDTIHELMRCADVAMYNAKSRGTPLDVYDRMRDIYSPARLKLLGAIPKAINASEFVLHYQPQVDLLSNLPTGYETLIRWQHPQHGLLPPGEFFPLAEVSDVIHPLTSHMLDIAMGQAREWRNQGMSVRTAINLSARNILDPRLTYRLTELLDKHGLAPDDIEIEVTETALLHDPATSAMVLQGLADKGLVLALDDFGTGFSSLSYLKRYPFSVVKIDRSFISDIEHDPASLAIVRSTIRLAHELNMKVVAEGVASQETVDLLRDLKCDMVQGFFISRPIEHNKVADWHRDWVGVK